jgi:hypothetical protein
MLCNTATDCSAKQHTFFAKNSTILVQKESKNNKICTKQSNLEATFARTFTFCSERKRSGRWTTVRMPLTITPEKV